MIKGLRNSKTEHILFLIFSKSIFFIFFQNKLKLIKHNNFFAIRRRSAEIIKKKKI